MVLDRRQQLSPIIYEQRMCRAHKMARDIISLFYREKSRVDWQATVYARFVFRQKEPRRIVVFITDPNSD